MTTLADREEESGEDGAKEKHLSYKKTSGLPQQHVRAPSTHAKGRRYDPSQAMREEDLEKLYKGAPVM